MKRNEMKKLKQEICKDLPLKFTWNDAVMKAYPLDDFKGNKKRIIKEQDTRFFYSTAESLKGNIVFRYYLVWYTNTRQTNKRICNGSEIYRFMLTKDGKILFCKKQTYSCMYNVYFRYQTDFEYKQFNQHVNERWNFPSYKMGSITKPKFMKYCDFKKYDLKILNKKNDYRYGWMTLLDYAVMFTRNQKIIETLQNIGRFDLIIAYYNSTHGNCYETSSLEKEIMSLARHNIEIKEMNIWLDYIHACKEIGMDTHNPQILNPKNLNEANSLVEKKLFKRRKEIELKKQLEEAMKHEPVYEKRIRNYQEIDIGNEKYSIKILPDIKSFKDEADVMHHCVFRMKYYDKKNSFIFSVRDRVTNKRIETAELVKHNSEFKLNQLYGACDMFTEHHNTIKKIIERNVGLLIRPKKEASSCC